MTIFNYQSSISTILLLLLLRQHARAQTAEPESNSDSPNDKHHKHPSASTIIINVIAVVIFIAISYCCTRICTSTSTEEDDYYNDDIESPPFSPPRRPGGPSIPPRRPGGLDVEVIQGFPIFDYAVVKAAKFGNDALECAVCLTEFKDDDTLRLIPRCDHVFHPGCIDRWLADHTTCPVCRCNLAANDVVVGPPRENLNDVVVGPPRESLNDVVVEVEEVREDNHEEENRDDLMERVRKRRSTMRNLSFGEFGRPRWLGKSRRSLSTGHVEVKKLENMERFTLRLPEDIRKRFMRAKLEKSDNSTRGWFGRLRDRARLWSGQSGFSLTPPFLTPARSLRSIDGEGSGSSSSRGSSSQENVSTSDCGSGLTWCSNAIKDELAMLST